MKAVRLALRTMAVAIVMSCFAAARADWASFIPLHSAVTVTIDEYGNGIAQWLDPEDGSSYRHLPWDMLKDTGPGGLDEKLTYSLMGPNGLAEGDVRLFDRDNLLHDIIRFNFDDNPLGAPGTIVFYSDNWAGEESPADSDPPPLPHELVAEIYRGVLSYTPDGPIYVGGREFYPAWPGYVPDYRVTYKFVEHLVPVPGAAVLAALGFGLVGWTRGRPS